MNTAKLTVSVNAYTLVHGRTPRGYGDWIFAPLGFERSVYAADWKTFNGTYTEARAALRASGAHGTWVTMP